MSITGQRERIQNERELTQIRHRERGAARMLGSLCFPINSFSGASRKGAAGNGAGSGAAVTTSGLTTAGAGAAASGEPAVGGEAVSGASAKAGAGAAGGVSAAASCCARSIWKIALAASRGCASCCASSASRAHGKHPADCVAAASCLAGPPVSHGRAATCARRAKLLGRAILCWLRFVLHLSLRDRRECVCRSAAGACARDSRAGGSRLVYAVRSYRYHVTVCAAFEHTQRYLQSPWASGMVMGVGTGMGHAYEIEVRPECGGMRR